MGDCAHPDKVLVKDTLKQKTTTKEAKESRQYTGNCAHH